MSGLQKALVLQSKFGEFAVGSTPIPKPGPGELLVKVQTAALNPIDWKVQKYGVYIVEYPAVLGLNIAGDVEEVGEGVTNFSKGDRVLSQGTYEPGWSAFQQYTKTNATTTTKIPAHISYDEGSTFPATLSAAYAGLYGPKGHGVGLDPPITESAIGKYANTPIVILGGGSCTGQFAIQLAKLSGLSPIITTASLKHTNSLKSLGATNVIDRNAPLLDEVRKITDQPITIIFDSISNAETQQAGLDLLAPRGTIVVITPPTIKSDEKEILRIMGQLSTPTYVELFQTLYGQKLAGLLEKGLIKPNRVEVLSGGLAAIPAGLKRLEKNEVSGAKLVVHPQES